MMSPSSKSFMSRDRFQMNLLTNCNSLKLLLLLLKLLLILYVQPAKCQYVFNSPPYLDYPRVFQVSETELVGNRVFTVNVKDNEGDDIRFSIEPSNHHDGSEYFRIDQDTGDVYLTKTLVGKGLKELYIFVKANDGHNAAKFEFLVMITKKQTNDDKKQSSSGSKWSGPLGQVPALISLFPGSKPKETSFTVVTSSPTARSTTRHPEPPSLNALNNHKVPSKNFTTDVFSQDDSKKDASKAHLVDSTNRMVALASVCGLFLSVCLVVCLVIKCQRSAPTRNAIKTFSHKIINNNKSDSTVISFTTTESDYSGALFTQKSIKDKSISSSCSLSSEWEFPRHHLKFIHVLGQGCFGQVWKCEAVNISKTGGSQVVAVKTLKENSSVQEKNNLLAELEVMKMLEPHPNVVTLIGCCAEQDPVLVIMEFVPNGTLQNYLRESRVDLNYGNSHGSKLTSRDLISFAYQVAKGMEYLSSKGIIHRDLAARNVLVGYNKVCKIADFGFAKYDHVYERKSDSRLPIRWMAQESLTDRIFTTKSDVWSFGILMWEIVTLGCTPYPEYTAAEVCKKVCQEGFRMGKPQHCKREMFNIMYYCWDPDPVKRPSFTELVSLLDNLIYSENDYIELDRFPEHSYYNILKSGNVDEKL